MGHSHIKDLDIVRAGICRRLCVELYPDVCTLGVEKKKIYLKTTLPTKFFLYLDLNLTEC